jgi:LytS/YehU family sensor histidine kinase
VGVAGALGAAFGVAWWLISQHVPTIRLHPGPPIAVGRAMAYGFTYGQLYFGLWALAFVYPFALEDARVRALEADKLRSLTELARLRAHLEPHFLLNTLNAIAGLVTEEPREARRLLACLGDLLRDALRSDEMQPLEEQIEWLQRYAAILEARHTGVLAFSWDVAPETRHLLLPRLLLQPLVENAVKHGALRRRSGGRVSVRAARSNGALLCVIEDNGPGMSDADIRAGAFGLHAVRRGLELRQPGAKLRLESSPHGTRSIIELPETSAGAPAAVS